MVPVQRCQVPGFFLENPSLLFDRCRGRYQGRWQSVGGKGKAAQEGSGPAVLDSAYVTLVCMMQCSV